MNINIDTKYNVGDKVWVIVPCDRPYVTTFKINSIKIATSVIWDFISTYDSTEPGDYKITNFHEIVFHGHIDDKFGEVVFKLEHVYPTKEALLNSL